jgi:hypothetical protein
MNKHNKKPEFCSIECKEKYDKNMEAEVEQGATMDYTPGPWKWKGLPHLRYRGKYCFLVNNEGYELLSGSPVPSPHICIDNDNDAHLIAAAPDMYETLIALVNHVNTSSEPIPEELWKQADRALLKAAGKE